MKINDIKIHGEVLWEHTEDQADWVDAEIDVDIKGSYQPAVELRFFDGDGYQALRISAEEILALAELVKARTR
jgi:hypothetical protein